MRILFVTILIWIGLLMYISLMTGCLDTYTEYKRIELQPAVATISGETLGDSIIATLWTCDSMNVDIISPDSLVSEVRIYKKGVYTFTLWVQNVWGGLDSANQVITVK